MMTEQKDSPCISVLVTTHQHEPYIRDCLDGIIAQRTRYRMEVLVGVDEGTDRTLEICQEYAERHPDLIRLFPLKQSRKQIIQGVRTGRCNLVNVYSQARGRYWALCEGDDYWIDPEKLEKQIDYLEQHADCSICFHNVWVEEDGRRSRFQESFAKPTLETADILEDWLVPTCSMVGRRIINTFPEWHWQVLSGDLMLQLLHSVHGKLGWIDGELAVYRKHIAGSSRRVIHEKNLLNLCVLFSSFNSDTGGRFQVEIESALRRYIERIYAKDLAKPAYIEGRRSLKGDAVLADAFSWRELMGAIGVKLGRLCGRRKAAS